MLQTWTSGPNPIDIKEQGRRTIDLFIVSVLLDAGAGNIWKYEEKATGKTFARSEGLGVASFRMFESGFFSSVPDQSYRVDGTFVLFSWRRITLKCSIADGLAKITSQRVSEAMQVTSENPMVGVDGRTALLSKLGEALKAHPEYFGKDGRPGNIIGIASWTPSLNLRY